MHIYNTCERIYIFVCIDIKSKLPGIICHLAEIQHTHTNTYTCTHTPHETPPYVSKYVGGNCVSFNIEKAYQFRE